MNETVQAHTVRKAASRADILGAFWQGKDPVVQPVDPHTLTFERLEALATHADSETASLVPHKRIGRF